jgi:two-component system, LuxR family, response regulator FixJ
LAETVYIVDDDDAVRDSLKGLLESQSYGVEAFASGSEFLKRHTRDFAGCLVLDVNLPELDGFEILARLGPARAELPVIMITAQGNPAIESRALEAGATAFIGKPFAADAFLALIRKAMERRGGE